MATAKTKTPTTTKPRPAAAPIEVEFHSEGPPPRRRGRRPSIIHDVMEQLSQRPDTWAVVRVCSPSLASSTQSSLRKSETPGLDVTTRVRSDNKVEVWAMLRSVDPTTEVA